MNDDMRILANSNYVAMPGYGDSWIVKEFYGASSGVRAGGFASKKEAEDWIAAHAAVKPIPSDRPRSVRTTVRAVVGAAVYLPAENVDFSKTYAFQIEAYGRTYHWVGVRPTRDGDDAVFELRDQELNYESKP